jgi:adenylate cyclase
VPVAPITAVGEHKHVTVLFADVVGSMKLAAALDPERLQEIMHELFNKSAAIVQRYQGTVDKFTGDGLMALFGAPVALEDHALRACIAALEIQEATTQLAAEVQRRDQVQLKLRVGLNSGEVIAGEIGRGPGRYTAVGHPVGMAQRMEAAAKPGTILCSESTARLVEDTVKLSAPEYFDVKGETEQVLAHQVLSVTVDQAVMGRDDGPMLGRDGELGKLVNVFQAAQASIIGVVGEPGIGKSRLIREFAERVNQMDADVVIARCDAHTTNVPLWALARMLRAMFAVGRLDDDPTARAKVMQRLPSSITADSHEATILFDLLGIAEPNGAPIELSLDARRRRLIDAMTEATEFRPRPTLFILEDVHWIDAASEATLVEFAANLPAARSALVTSYRPEYRGPLRQQRDVSITLGPLTADATTAIAAGVIGKDPSVTGVAELVARSAYGNPFFVEQMVRDLVDRGILVGNRGGYRREGLIDQITLPATVQSLLAARIDRLPPQAKSALNAAAVIGSTFDLDVVHAVLPNTDRADFADLVSVELVDQIEFVPRARFCFRHPLVRKVAYDTQLSATRARTHRRLAGAIQEVDPTGIEDNAALIGTHLEAAGDLEAAHGWHIRAAERLQTRDMVAARTSWERARRVADRLPDEHDGITALRAAPRAMLAWTDWLVGADPDADTCHEELRALTTQSGDALSLAVGIAGRMTALCTNYARPAEAAALAADLVDMIDDIGADAVLKVDLLFTVMWAQFLICDYDALFETAHRLQAIAGTEVNSSIARSNAVLGVSRIVTGDVENGRRELQLGIDQARETDAVTYAAVMTLKCCLAAVGLEPPDATTLDQAYESLRRAEAFGDNFAIACALWACGTTLLRLDHQSAATAVEYLEAARNIITKHRTVAVALSPIEADLAIMVARAGDVDGAIDSLRAVIQRQVEQFDVTFMGVTTPALIQLLMDRGGENDIAEATAMVEVLEIQGAQLKLPALQLCAAHCRVVTAGTDAQRGAAMDEYRATAERIGARGEFLPLHPSQPG